MPIRLMSDFGLYPFYVDEGNGLYELTEPEDFQTMFQLPDHVMKSLLEWDQIYQRRIDWDDPASVAWASQQDELHYIEEGRGAARRLRDHVPPDVRIEYTGADNIASEYY
ncbi:hypothetical protein [Pseudonocardia sp. GCM10023141]|uniref:hypothetical protein n=1 Tax=Pseudonocardia sp. GCM10023141 TaxID=3252653 RepID=UPI00361A3129